MDRILMTTDESCVPSGSGPAESPRYLPTPTPTITPTPTVVPGTEPAVPPGQVWRFSYFAGAQRIALRVIGDPDPARNGLFFLVADHLGNMSMVLDQSGQLIGERLYMAWGEVRYEYGWGTTEYGYTGQREQAGIGLYYYRARWYDPGLGRFTQPDPLIPSLGSPTSFDRYSYVRNNPLIYIDPTSHILCGSPYALPGECTDTLPTSTYGEVLSTENSELGISSLDVYLYYRKLWIDKIGKTGSTNWWWNAFGTDDDGFTIWDFLSMMAYSEAGFDNSIVASLAEGGVRFFYGVLETQGTDPTLGALLDWWARFSGSTAKQIRDGAALLHITLEQVRDFLVVGDSFHDPPEEWQGGYSDQRPYGWGNAQMLPSET